MTPFRMAAAVVTTVALSTGGMVAASGTVAAGSAAYAATSTPTTLGIREAHQAIRPGGTNRLSGQLRAQGSGALAGATVELRALPRAARHWQDVKDAVTNSSGVVTFVVSPPRTTRYQLAYAGDATHRSTVSGVVTTHVVRRLPTAIAVHLRRQSIAVGDSDRIWGRLHVARHHRGFARRTLALEQQTSNGWQRVATERTNRHGAVRFSVTPPATTSYALSFAGGPKLRPSRSRVVTVWVGQPTSLSITSSAASVDPGQPVTVSGVLTSDGAPVAGQAVELRARPAGQRRGSTVQSGVTASDGTVSFSTTPSGTTTYRLRFRHTDTLAAAWSPGVTVVVRQPTSMSIRFTSGAGTGTDTVSGSLRGGGSGLAGQTVTLQSRPAGSTDADWTDLATGTTGDNGFVSFPVTPTAPTDYRLAFAPTARWSGCDSGIVTSS